jgi:hypothetical protein
VKSPKFLLMLDFALLYTNPQNPDIKPRRTTMVDQNLLSNTLCAEGLTAAAGLSRIGIGELEATAD